MTDDSAFKKQVRARMAETGEKYTTARRMVIAGRGPGQPRVALRVYLNPHVDLELTDETARAFAAAGHQVQREMANRLLADHIELAGSAEADRLGAELEELTGKPVQLNILEARPEKGRKEIQLGPQVTQIGRAHV